MNSSPLSSRLDPTSPSVGAIVVFAAATWAAFATWFGAVGSSEAGVIHVAALVAALAAWWRDRSLGPPHPGLSRASWALLGVYACLAYGAPRFVALAVAFLAIALRFAASTRDPRRAAGLFVLWGAALPFAEITQAFVGVPLRSIAAALASGWLRASGAAVESVGVAIREGDAYFFVDPACGGLRSAWSALFLAGVLAALFRLRWPSACALVATAGVAAVLANALRTSALFWLERAPDATGHADLAHSGIGVVSFALAAAALVALAWRWRSVEVAR